MVAVRAADKGALAALRDDVARFVAVGHFFGRYGGG
jgi:hypothetical protein